MDLRDYKLVAMHDPSSRRGIWVKASEKTAEIRVGREGDDLEITFKLGEPITSEHLSLLREVGQMGEYYRDQEANHRFFKREPLNHHQAEMIFQTFDKDGIAAQGVTLSCEKCERCQEYREMVQSPLKV